MEKPVRTGNLKFYKIGNARVANTPTGVIVYLPVKQIVEDPDKQDPIQTITTSQPIHIPGETLYEKDGKVFYRSKELFNKLTGQRASNPL